MQLGARGKARFPSPWTCRRAACLAEALPSSVPLLSPMQGGLCVQCHRDLAHDHLRSCIHRTQIVLRPVRAPSQVPKEQKDTKPPTPASLAPPGWPCAKPVCLRLLLSGACWTRFLEGVAEVHRVKALPSSRLIKKKLTATQLPVVLVTHRACRRPTCPSTLLGGSARHRPPGPGNMNIREAWPAACCTAERQIAAGCGGLLGAAGCPSR